MTSQKLFMKEMTMKNKQTALALVLKLGTRWNELEAKTKLSIEEKKERLRLRALRAVVLSK